MAYLSSGNILFIVIVPILVVGLVLFVWILCKKTKVKEVFERNKPIIVHMFNKNLEIRRNAVIEKNFQSRVDLNVEVDLAPTTPASDTKTDIFFDVDLNDDTDIKPISSHLSKSLPDLKHIVSINESTSQKGSENENENQSETDSVILDETKLKKLSGIFEDSDDVIDNTKDTHKNPSTKHGITNRGFSTVQVKPSKLRHSVLNNRIQNAYVNRKISEQQPPTHYSSLSDLRHQTLLSQYIPRATSVERIPINNARKFKECKLTEISPGCFSVPIDDSRKEATMSKYSEIILIE